jgi:membrane peptidoglycan carboxypeptidase
MPGLVREVRDADGAVTYRHAAEPVRRVLTPEVAATLREYLKAAVSETGTGVLGTLTNYDVVGKTGTANMVVNGHYDLTRTTASFAAIFPKNNPQLIIVTKIDAPKGGGFGGKVAAPATRRMLEQALAARHVALDRWQLVRRGVDTAHAPAPSTGTTESTDETPAPRFVATWPLRPSPQPDSIGVVVPDVQGLDVRAAALKLHRRGFRVAVSGLGHVVGSAPAAGKTVQSGALVTLQTE